MFFRSKDKTAPEEIEMKELKSSVDLTSIILPNMNVDISRLSATPSITLAPNIQYEIDELHRTPKKIYANADPRNETEGLISRILDDIWINLFSFLDIKTLTFMLVSSKKIAMLANDDKTRERLYKTREKYAFFKLLQPQATSLHPLLDRAANAATVFHQPPTLQHQDPQAYQFYNDNPLGQGFVMK